MPEMFYNTDYGINQTILFFIECYRNVMFSVYSTNRIHENVYITYFLGPSS